MDIISMESQFNKAMRLLDFGKIEKGKPENRLVVLPDAIQKYDGKPGFMAANGSAKFVGEGVSIESLS